MPAPSGSPTTCTVPDDLPALDHDASVINDVSVSFNGADFVSSMASGVALRVIGVPDIFSVSPSRVPKLVESEVTVTGAAFPLDSAVGVWCLVDGNAMQAEVLSATTIK